MAYLLRQDHPCGGRIALPLVLGDTGPSDGLCAVYGLLALSWTSWPVRAFSLGRPFFRNGAYLVGIMNHYFGWPVVVTLPLHLVRGRALHLASGARDQVEGVYFAMVTLVIPSLFSRSSWPPALRRIARNDHIHPLRRRVVFHVLYLIHFCLPFALRRIIGRTMALS